MVEVSAYDAGYRSHKRYTFRKSALEEAATLRKQGYNAIVMKLVAPRTGSVDYMVLIRKRKR